MDSNLLPPALSTIADYIEQHPLDPVLLNAHELALRCRVSDTAVSRFAKLAGHATYPQMRLAARELIVDAGEPVVEAAARKMRVVRRRRDPSDWRRRLSAAIRATTKAHDDDALASALVRVAAEALAAASLLVPDDYVRGTEP